MKDIGDFAMMVLPAKQRRLRVLAGGLLTTAAFAVIAGCASGSGGGSGKAPPGAKTSIWGYVLTVKGKDTVKVAGAEVRTDPVSDLVHTDSLGYWEIKEGLAETKYKVLARSEGDSGQTSMITVPKGEATQAIVMLGVRETRWPSTISPDNKGVYIPAGIANRRGLSDIR